MSNTTALVVFGAITLIIAYVGYELIHRLGVFVMVLFGLLFAVAAFVLVKHATTPAFVPASAFGHFNASALMLTITQSAAWSLSFGPYVADYSRYLPDRKEKLFRNRYRHFADVADARFMQLDAEEPDTQSQIAALCADFAKTISTIVISFDDPPHGLSIALSLLDGLRSYAPIRLRLNDDSGLAALLPRGQITGFGSIRDACKRKSWLDSDLDAMARTLHEDYLGKLPEAERSR